MKWDVILKWKEQEKERMEERKKRKYLEVVTDPYWFLISLVVMNYKRHDSSCLLLMHKKLAISTIENNKILIIK